MRHGLRCTLKKHSAGKAGMQRITASLACGFRVSMHYPLHLYGSVLKCGCSVPSFSSANRTGYEDVIVVRRETLVMTELQLSSLPNLPQREAIAEVASNLWQDVGVVALWVGGSLASGAGDHFSDVDFRVAVVPDQLARWKAPRFEQLFTRASIVGWLVLQFGNEALLHHLVLSNGVIFDFFVQSTTRRPTQEPLLIHVRICSYCAKPQARRVSGQFVVCALRADVRLRTSCIGEPCGGEKRFPFPPASCFRLLACVFHHSHLFTFSLPLLTCLRLLASSGGE